MSHLDHSAGCVNFRDVGEFLHLLSDDHWLPPGKLLRGGKLDAVLDSTDIGSPGTILNLRKGPDTARWAATNLHLPTANVLEVYNTADRSVKRWLSAVVNTFQGELTFPVLLHCTSGKDRTGVAVAALLHILGVPRHLIVEEYLLSEGEVRAEWIEQALDGIGEVHRYFQGLDLGRIKANLRGA